MKNTKRIKSIRPEAKKRVKTANPASFSEGGKSLEMPVFKG
jgi:hypothetical protein